MAYQEKKYLQKTQGICLLQRISFSRVIKWNFDVSEEWKKFEMTEDKTGVKEQNSKKGF